MGIFKPNIDKLKKKKDVNIKKFWISKLTVWSDKKMKSKMRLMYLVIFLLVASLFLTSCCFDFDEISKSVEESLIEELSNEILTDEAISYKEIVVSDGSAESLIERTKNRTYS